MKEQECCKQAAQNRLSGIKVIITDLDHTLLHEDKSISAYTAGVLKRCRKQGYRIVFATARPRRDVVKYLEQVDCDALIYHNGAFVEAGGARIGEPHRISIEKTRKLLRELHVKYPGRRLSVEIADVLYANFNVKEFWSFTEALRSDFTDLPEEDADKLIIEIGGPQDCKELAGRLWDEVYGETADGRLYLIMNRNATKHGAVRELGAYWGIPEAAMLAFGDDINDLGMLKECGLGIAVGNGLDEVKEIADLVIGTNEEDGPAVFLESCLLKEL